MKFLSVCSGIESASVAWDPLGWSAVAFSEIEPFPCALLAHRYPDVPNWGDLNRFQEWPDAAIDVLVGGTPCQDLSAAGKRAGLQGARGQLTLQYARVAYRYRPQWLVWENVPGVFSSSQGRDFGTVLARFAGWPDDSLFERPKRGWGTFGVVPPAGPDRYGLAWRVLDAQYFGLAQRRRRVFVVGYLGDWRPAAAVLLEPEGLRGDPAPSRSAGEGFTRDVTPGLVDGGEPVAKGGSGHGDFESETFIAQSFKPSHFTRGKDGALSGVAPPLSADADKGDQDTLIFETRFVRNGRGAPEPICPPLKAQSGADGRGVAAPVLASPMAVRRLTPRECERLQGFADDYTLIPTTRAQQKDIDAEMAAYYRRTNQSLTQAELERLAADGPRYKAIGNSKAVPVVRWIGRRIAEVDQICGKRKAAALP